MLPVFKSILYVQLAPDRLVVRNPRSGDVIDELPEIAISHSPIEKILAVGPQARAAAAAQDAVVVNPFAHPRSLVSDFTVAEQVLKHYLKRAQGHSWLKLAPVVIIHPLGSPAGGFTQVERRAFHEMALGAGASQAIVWTGRVLTDAEALARDFPVNEGIAGT